ncbi:MAG TPA: hypothetical protein PLW09_16415, partial [Candidatus Kapabacteria bacterium]|nr:hypothetical protein [Candidatus Kapabacteria bacterium]
MKNFCTSVIFIIIGSAALYAQEVEPLLQFNINGQTQPFPVDTLRFRHKIPIIANWGVGRSIGDALNFKINHGSNISNPNNFTDSSGIVKAGDVTILGQGMEYEPTLIMTTQQCSPSGFVARPYDTQNQCFGFRNIDTTTGIISYDHTSYDYNRYQLRHDSLVAHTGGVRKKVLSGVWMNNQIGDEISNANGRTWYLTLNLRRLTSINYGSANDTVLSLRIKYWKLPLLNNIDSGYIRFDSAFQSSSSTASTSRGLMDNALNPTNRNGTDTIFVIRRSYLPAYQNNGGSITLSSHFTTNGINSLPWDNPLFAPFNRGYVNSLMRGRDIDSIDVEVYYHGAADIGLDWIRIENTQLRSIVRGAYDNSVKNNVQTSLNTIAAMGRGITYHRVYLADEQPILRWRGLGYWNRVLNNGGQMEVVMEYPSHFAHSIGFKELWNNLGVPMANNTAAPYVRNGHGGIIDTSMAFSSMLGLKSGWHNGNTSSDGSSYEMIKFKSNSRSLGVQGFFDDLFSAFSLQFVPYLTSGKSSWGQVWVYSNWNKRRFYNSNINARDSSASTTYWRPQTGEEIRLEAWPQLILGVKGLAFYILGNAGYGENHWFLGGASGTYQGSIIGRTLIDSPLLGTDYLLWGNDSASNGDTYLHAHLNSSVINWNALGINQNRIYIGRRSQRMEILKLTDYLKATEKELSNLYLRAYYTKSLNSKLLGKTQDFTRFISIDTNYLKIRPVGRVDTNNQPYHEAFSDSVCVDITLLHSKDTINYPSSSTVYIGVCNRKSSPLFRSPINNNDWTFYPTRMFDSLTLGENMTQSDRNMWANYRYKQSGSREVNIPFKFTSPDNSYALLQITELGADDPYLDSVYNYRNNPALYQKVDTVICQDGTLSLKLLPGEGKIFRVRVLPTDPSV